MISETKLDESFPTNQFMIKGFSTLFSLDGNDKDCGIILFCFFSLKQLHGWKT